MMKKIVVILVVIMAGLFTSCRTYTTSYQAQALSNNNQRLGVQGAKGTVLFKVFTYERSVEAAREKALMDAVHAVLTQGIPNSSFPNPLLKDPVNGIKNNRQYFDRLFGDNKYLDKQNIKIHRRQARKGTHSSFVQLADDGSVNPQDVVKVNSNTYKVGITVSVNYEALRKELISKGIEVNVSQGFGW
jgi:hypothetical protein